MTFSTHLENQENIRLISVIAHVDHGKTTLTDSLLARAGIIDENQAGSKRGTDTMEEEKERGITIRSTGVSMHFQEVKKPGDNYVVHLVDSPGHVDFSSEVTAALRVSDGALVVVDCIEGVCAQTETVLRQALAERVKPVLVLNKIDRAVLELKLSPEDAYKSFEKTIQAVNDVISTYSSDTALGDLTLHPAKGNVVFASGLFGWGFTLHQFASKIIAKSGSASSVEDVAKRLWGEHYFNEETKKFSKSATSPSGAPLERYACKVVFAPIFKMVKAIMEGDLAVVNQMLASAGTALAEKDKEKTGKDLMRVAMRLFLPLADALLNAIVDHVPNPKVAQKYRVDLLYDGDLNDRFAKAIRECDPNGPLVAYISKLFPVPNTKSFFAFGRIFSGTARQGQKVYVFDPSRTSKAKEERTKSIQNLLCMSIRAMDRLEACPCGNIMAIAGIDSMLIKSGTISDEPECGMIKSMKFSVSPVVRAAVSCKSAADLPKLVDGLRALAKVDPCVQCIVDEESGEHIVGCAGDLHLQVCMRILQSDYCKGVSIIVSEPMVSYRETIAQESVETYLTKSPNKHNRLYGIAQPLTAQLCADIDDSPSIVMEDSKARAQRLIEQGWDDNEAKRKVWCFGPELEPTNALVDGTFGLAFMNEIADHMKSAFSWATNEGPICGEPVRGVKFSLKDATLHADAIHRGGGQIIPTARRLYHACIIGSSPRLMEPIYVVEVQTTQEYSGNVYSVIARKRGQVFAEEHREGTPIVTLKANLPVMESFNLTADLRAACHGQAFPQCAFSHWQIMEGDPLVSGNLASTVAAAVRLRKKMPATIPTLEGLVDKL